MAKPEPYRDIGTCVSLKKKREQRQRLSTQTDTSCPVVYTLVSVECGCFRVLLSKDLVIETLPGSLSSNILLFVRTTIGIVYGYLNTK